MLFNSKRKKMEQLMNMMQEMHFSSKSSLKHFCLLTAKGNVDEASKMYDFLVKDMEELPMFDPVKPTALQNIKATVAEIFSFIKENGDEIQQGVAIVRGMMGKGSGIGIAPVGDNLPPINE